jgi:hypothetical protein
MADPTNVIQHDFGFPRVIRAEDAEREALYAMLVSLGATKMMAERLMQDYPQHRIAAQAIVDFASDGEGDMRGAIAKLEALAATALARRRYLPEPGRVDIDRRGDHRGNPFRGRQAGLAGPGRAIHRHRGLIGAVMPLAGLPRAPVGHRHLAPQRLVWLVDVRRLDALHAAFSALAAAAATSRISECWCGRRCIASSEKAPACTMTPDFTGL